MLNTVVSANNELTSMLDAVIKVSRECLDTSLHSAVNILCMHQWIKLPRIASTASF